VNTKSNKRSTSPSPPCHSFSYESIPVTFPSKIEVQENNTYDPVNNFVKEEDTIEFPADFDQATEESNNIFIQENFISSFITVNVFPTPLLDTSKLIELYLK
jgi:hypothetical protein